MCARSVSTLGSYLVVVCSAALLLLLDGVKARASLAAELHQRTELEVFLRQCVEDVRLDIARKRTDVLTQPHTSSPLSTGRGTGRDGGESGDADGGISLADFSTADREKVLELLLSQERVINLLYSKTFPSMS